MGHTEMVLAVAGLDQKSIDDRVRRLGSGDWSSFPPAERVSYQFAYRQAKGLNEVQPQNVRQLAAVLGPDRALDVIWWTCRCHYMTTVSDAFRLPLESTNVFDGFAGP